MGDHAVIVAGFGFRQSATLDSLRDALDLACAGQYAPDLLTTPEDKAPMLVPLGHALGLPVQGIPADVMRAQTPQTEAAASYAARGTGSVAEACALAGAKAGTGTGAGLGADLLAPRVISGDKRATCALARASAPLCLSPTLSLKPWPRSETP